MVYEAKLMRQMKLSGRLSAVVSMIRPCMLLADVGCDHAYVAIDAVKKGIAAHAVASDTAAGPLKHAEQNIKLAGLEGKISTLISDGLMAYSGMGIKPDCIVITGMGGRLITRILMESLEAGFELKAVGQLVLGPQSEPEILRHFLLDHAGLNILNECCLKDEGKYYMLLDVGQSGTFDDGGGAYTEAEYLYGRHIDASALPAYREWLHKLREQKNAALSGLMAGLDNGGSDSAMAGVKKLTNDIMLINERLAAL